MDNSKSPSNSIKNDSKKPNILDNKNKEIELNRTPTYYKMKNNSYIDVLDNLEI